MADVRALLAAERQSRRITHPHLTYSKTGALTCNICNLNVKSEQLWPGHVKSLNHRKNVQKVPESLPRPAKREIDNVDDEELERNYEVDSRKKPKSAPESQEEVPPSAVPETLPIPESMAVVDTAGNADGGPGTDTQMLESAVQPPPVRSVDEDEWAAFEREVAEVTEVAQPDYTSATIEAAPVSATELAEQKKINAVQQREEEADAEKEDESRRMEEEFEVMEEMEDRLKRLRERRDALRTKDPTTELDAMVKVPVHNVEEITPETAEAGVQDSSDDEDADDWYG